MSDISATARLDVTAFNAGLQEALKEARAWKTAVQRDLSVDPIKNAAAAAKELAREFAKIKVPDLNRGAAAAATGAQQAATATAAAAVANRDLVATLNDVRERAQAAQQAYLSGATTIDQYRATQVGLKAEILAVAAAQSEQAKATDAFLAGVKETDAEVEELGIAVRNVRSAYIAGRTGADEFRVASEALKTQIDALYQSTNLNTSQQLKLNIASATAERGLAMLRGEASRLGLAQGVAIGTTNAWADSLRQLSGAITAIVAGAGLARYIQTLVGFSGEAAVARNTLALFFDALERGGTSADRGAAAIAALAKEFQTTEDAVGNGLTLLLRYGATLEQATLILQRAGASALAANRNAEEGFDAASNAIISEMSAALNRIGIAGNLSTAYRAEAKALGTTTEALTNQQKIQAVINQLLPETVAEYEALETILAGFVGAQNRASTAFTNFRRSIGKSAEAVLAPLFNSVTRVVNAFLALPAVLQGAITGAALLATTVASAGIAYVTLTALLTKLNVRQLIGNTLLGNEVLQRTTLGRQITVLAGRYRLLTREQIANSAASATNATRVTLLGTAGQAARAGLQAAARGMGALTLASARFLLTPVGLALTAIGAAVALVVTAVRRFDQVVKPAFDAFEAAVSTTATAFEPLKQAMEAVSRVVGPALADFFRNVLARVAFVAGGAVLFLAETFEKLAIVTRFFTDIASVGLRQAWTNMLDDVERVQTQYEGLRAELFANAQAAANGSLAARTLTDDVATTGDTAEDTAEDLRKLMDAALDLRKGFEARFEDQALGFLPDGLEKDIEAVRLQFRRLRDEITEAASANEMFAPFAQGLLAQAYENEQKTILQIQERYADERRTQAERQARELEATIRERERAIVDARTSGTLTDTQALTLATERRLQDTEALYRDLIAKAREYKQDTSNLERLRTQELLAIQEEYARDVNALWADLQTELTSRQRDLLRDVLSARGDERGLLGFDFDTEMRDLEEFYADARTRADGNANLLALIETQEAAARAQKWDEYWNLVLNLTESGAQGIIEAEEDLARQRAELANDQPTIARIDNAREIREINRRYDDLEAAAAGNAARLAQIANARNEALSLANQRLNADLGEITATALTRNVAPAIAGVVAALNTADIATTRSLQAQLEAWRRTYAGNTGIIALIDDALKGVDTRFGQLTTALTEQLGDADLATATSIQSQLLEWREAYGADGVIVALVDAALSRVTERINRLQSDSAASVAEGLQTIFNLEEGLARRRAELAGDAGAVASIDSAAQLRDIEAWYERLTRVFADNDAVLVQLAQLRNDAIALENQALADNLRGLTETAQAEAFEPAITSLLTGLDDAALGVIASIRTQLTTWREAYGANGQIAALVDAALERVSNAHQKAQENIAAGTSSVLQLEEDVARRRAELAENAVALATIDSAAAIRDIETRYEELVGVFEGNDAELARLARVRNDAIAIENEALANNLRELSEAARAEAFAPALAVLLDGLANASRATTVSTRAQLEAWVAAYADNGPIVESLTRALDAVDDRYAKLRENSSSEIDSMISDAERLAAAIRSEDAQRGLSDVDQLLFSAARRIGEVRDQRSALEALMADATDSERVRLTTATQELDAAIRTLQTNASEDAAGIAENAVRVYADGLERARADAGRAAVDAVTGDVRNLFENLVESNTAALNAARDSLYALLNDLTVAGVPDGQLADIRVFIAQVNTLIERHALNLANFAAEQFQIARQIGAAVLSERDARALNLGTLATEVDARERALRVTRALAAEERATGQEVLRAQAQLVEAQLAQLTELESVTASLQEQRRSLLDVYAQVPGVADASVEDSLTARRDSLLDQVTAAQAAGQAYTEYAGVLSDLLAVNERLGALDEARIGQVERDASARSRIAANEGVLLAVRREAAESALEAATSERARTAAQTEALRVSGAAITAYQLEAAALRELAQQYVTAGDLQRAISTRDQLVALGQRTISGLRQEAAAARALAVQYGQRATAIRGIRDEVDALGNTIRGISTEPVNVRAELERLRLMQQQGASLEEQRDQFQRVAQAAEAAGETGRKLSGRERIALQDAEAAFQSKAATEARAARASEAAAEKQAKALEDTAGGAVTSLTADVAALNELLRRTLDTGDNALQGVFAGIANDIALVPERVAAIDAELATVRDTAQGLTSDLRTLIAAFQLDPNAAVGNILSSLPTTDSLGAAGREAGAAYARELAGSLDELDEALQAALGPAAAALTSGAITAGETAGVGLTDAFGEGIRSGEAGLLAIIDSVLQKVRDRLPSSDAKVGPLSTLTASGRTFFPTWMSGVKEGQARVARTMNSLLANMRPSAAFTAMNGGAGALAGAGGPAIGTLNIDGRPASVVPGPLALNARQLARTALNEAAAQLRLRGRR